MGIDLYLLPFDCDLPQISFSHTILKVPRDYEMFDRINKCEQHPVPKDFTSFVSRDEEYEESHYGTTTEDSYGARVMYILAGDLKTVGLESPIRDYINALPDETKVALFWC